ncbi:hypothetical protein VTO73DRAFT_7345 [Trametes versicolor]
MPLPKWMCASGWWPGTAASGAGRANASVDRRLLDRRRGMDACAGVCAVRLVAGLEVTERVLLNVAYLSGVLRVCTLFPLTAILLSAVSPPRSNVDSATG